MNKFLDGIHFGLEETSILVVTIFLCVAILNSRGTIFNRRARKDMRQAQRTHSMPTPRLGGAVIFAAVLASSIFMDGFFGGRYAKFAIAMLPMTGVALWEDMVRPTSPLTRLSATLVSCFLTVMSLQIWFTSIDIPLLDLWFTSAAGILMTVAFVAASVNGFNMVDGLNGLCAGISLAALMALHMIATAVGHQFISHIALTLAVATAGLLLFNFPKARIFLGDTGSYLIGYIIAWFGVSLSYWYTAVSPWAIFLILAYPLSELALTVARRVLSGRSPFQPDTSHMHHLVLLLLRQTTSHGKPMAWQNPTATLIILPFAIAPMVPAVLLYDSPRMLQGLTLSYGLAIACLYAGLFVLTRKLERKTAADNGIESHGAVHPLDSGSSAATGLAEHEKAA